MFLPQQRPDWAAITACDNHEIFVISFDEMERLSNSHSPASRELWQQLRGKVENTAGNYSLVMDAVLLDRLIRELGGVGAKAYIKNYGGKPHIILKGYPGLRRVLTSTKYAMTNAKVIQMGLGRVGAANVIKHGGILTIYLMSAFRVADYVLTDKATLTQLIGRLAADVVTIGMAAGLSFIGMEMGAAFVGVAVGPLLGVVVIGLALLLIDKGFDINISDKLGEVFVEYLERQQAQATHLFNNRINDALERLHKLKKETTKQALHYVVKSGERFIIEWAKHQLNPRRI